MKIDINKKIDYLQKLSNKFGDFDLQINKIINGKKIITKRFSVLSLWENEDMNKLNTPEFQNTKTYWYLLHAGHRSKLQNEIIFDFDDYTKEQSFEISKYLFKSLKSRSEYIGLFESNRGYHLQIISKKLSKKTKFLNNVMSLIKSDTMLLNSKQLISLEFERHWRTNKVKKLIMGDWIFLKNSWWEE